MSEELELIQQDTASQMKKAINRLETELVKIRAGKANPNMLDGIVAEYYGALTPISQIANISVLDARTISVQPWEKKMLQTIERAIIASNIGINPQNDGNMIRLYLPPLTEERRKELVKRCNAEGEIGKVAIRNIRRDAIEQTKKLQKEGSISEDEAKDAEAEIQDSTNRYISLVEKHLDTKEKEIMAV
jgi:ribosome recycling factor